SSYHAARRDIDASQPPLRSYTQDPKPLCAKVTRFRGDAWNLIGSSALSIASPPMSDVEGGCRWLACSSFRLSASHWDVASRFTQLKMSVKRLCSSGSGRLAGAVRYTAAL